MSFLDTLLRGVKYIVNAVGVQMPQEPNVQFVGAGVSVADSPTTQCTVVTIPGGGGGSSGVQAPNVWTFASGPVFTYPTGVNTQESFDTSGGPITAVLDPSPLNGEVNGLKVVGRSLATNPLTLTGSSTIQLEYPPGTFQAASSSLQFNAGSSGIDVAWRYYGSYQTWFVEG